MYDDNIPERWGVYFQSAKKRRLKQMNNNQEMITLAKQVVLNRLNATRPVNSQYTLDDMYIVWFCKTLQNWKALVSTDVKDGLYWEVTYNGTKEELYVDMYTQMEHTVMMGSMHVLLENLKKD